MAEINQKEFDLGNGYTGQWIQWAPDRSIPANAENYKDQPDIPCAVFRVKCPHGNSGHAHPDTPEVRRVFPHGPHWTLVSIDPPYLEPSLPFMKYENGQHVPGCCHGFVRNGKWISA